jgi:multiple antibiotic resistance protein
MPRRGLPWRRHDRTRRDLHFFFVTLGPLKILGPFALQTRGLGPAALRGVALRVFVLSLAALAMGGWIGRSLLDRWHVSMPALLIATGIIFFLVALRVVLEQYEPPHDAAPSPLPAQPMAAALRLTSPTVVTPYGVAALIALLSATGDTVREQMIWGILFAVMVLNLVAMLFAHAVMHGVLLLGLRLLGAVLAVMLARYLAQERHLHAPSDASSVTRAHGNADDEANDQHQ